MATTYAFAGVGLMMVCCSSSSVAAMMMGGEETPTPAAAGAGAGAEDTGPSMLKCLDTRKRGEKGWTNASNGRKEYTEAEARALCVGKKYMSLECPNADGFEVWCADDISDMPVLADAECMGNTSDTSINDGKNGGCDAGGGSYLSLDGLNKGGHHRGSLYEI
jgi:hypothetical protein